MNADDLNWTTVGEGVPGYRRGRILAEINRLVWHDEENITAPMCPGEAIKKCITELRIPKVSAVAWNGVLNDRYGLYGIEGNYKQGPVRVYVVDLGSTLLPVASHIVEPAMTEGSNA